MISFWDVCEPCVSLCTKGKQGNLWLELTCLFLPGVHLISSRHNLFALEYNELLRHLQWLYCPLYAPPWLSQALYALGDQLQGVKCPNILRLLPLLCKKVSKSAKNSLFALPFSSKASAPLMRLHLLSIESWADPCNFLLLFELVSLIAPNSLALWSPN